MSATTTDQLFKRNEQLYMVPPDGGRPRLVSFKRYDGGDAAVEGPDGERVTVPTWRLHRDLAGAKAKRETEAVDAKIAAKFDPADETGKPWAAGDRAVDPEMGAGTIQSVEPAAVVFLADSPEWRAKGGPLWLNFPRPEGEQLTREQVAPAAVAKPARKVKRPTTPPVAVPERKAKPKKVAAAPAQKPAPTFFSAPDHSPVVSTPEPDHRPVALPRAEPSGDVRAEIHFGDCITGLAEKVADDSVHLTVTSIPFEELFTYSGKTEDVGNNGSTVDIREGRFALNLRFVVAQLLRVTAPGCNVAIHIQQLLAYKNQHGFMGRRDFRGAVIDLCRAVGFTFVGEMVIPKDPQAMAQRLSLHSLQFKTGHSRAAQNLAPCVNDYVLIFQKPGEAAVPVRCLIHPEKNPNGWVTTDEWIRWASGVWADVDEFDIIDGARAAKGTNDEKHVCLARGSLVLTRDGYVPIQDVNVGDMVLTHKGRWRPVLAKACNGRKPVVATEAQGVADLLTTPDHRLWARSCAGRGGKGHAAGSMDPSGHRRHAATAEPQWMEAQQSVGSYVNLKLPPIEESPLSAHDWWVIGRWLGDGHFDVRGRAHISCSHAEAKGMVAALADRAGHVAVRRTATQVAIKDRDGRGSTAFTAMLRRCGRGAAGKRLPVEALALDPGKAEALLSGYLSADGHYVAKYSRWTASSVSRPLLLGMAMVAQRARNVVASVYAGRPPGITTIDGRTVRTLQDWALSIPPRNVSAMLLGDGAWKKVRRVTPAGEAEVWDLQVAEDASFTAEGCVVHNCPLQLDVIRRCVKLWTNPRSAQPDVTVLDPFMGVGSTAAVAIELDRNVVGFELKESYHRAALNNVARARKARANRTAVTTRDLFAA